MQLQQGENILKIATDLECQGSYEKRFFYDNQYLIYPNPFQDEIKIYNGMVESEVSVSVYNTLGQMVLSKVIENKGADMTLYTDRLKDGVYLLKIRSKSGVSSYKIIKK